jgi:hypothetical protein
MRLDAITDMFQRSGPFLSVYADVSRDTESGGREVEARWEALARRATDQGAPEHLVQLVGRRVVEPTGAPGRNGRLVVADADDVLVDDLVPGPPHAEQATWSPLPDLGAWLVDRDLDLPLLVVVADHAGADLTTYRPGPGGSTEHDEVEGSTLHLHKVRHPRMGGRFGGDTGGASGERMRGDLQSSTEEEWRRNAHLVAREIDERAEGVALIALAGEDDACAGIREALGVRAQQRTVVVEHGARAAGASEESLLADVRAAARDAVVEERLGLVRTYQERKGQGRGYADGTHDVLAAAVLGQVETLLLDPDTAARSTVRPAEFEGLTLPEAVAPDAELRADQVAVAAAARTGAAVCVGGPHVLPDDGVAALLRWVA